jgi:hypothetical protein
MMSSVLSYGKQHVLALCFFAAYLLCWAGLTNLSIPVRPHVHPDACARGMLMIPLLAGLAASFVYCFTLLLFAVFNQGHSRFFWALLALALVPPFLVLRVL